MKNASFIRPALFALGLAIPALAAAQVTIPAQSASSLEGTSTGTTTAPVQPINSSPFTGNSSISKVNPPAATVGTGAATVTNLDAPVTSAPITTDVTAVQRVETRSTVPNVSVVKRLSVLRRDLRIAESALKARITLPTEQVFNVDDPTEVDRLADPTMKKIIEYLNLTNKKTINLRTYYVADENPVEAKELAWARSLALIEWMTEMGLTDSTDVMAGNPEPVTRGTPRPFSNEVGDTEQVGRIELNLE